MQLIVVVPSTVPLDVFRLSQPADVSAVQSMPSPVILMRFVARLAEIVNSFVESVIPSTKPIGGSGDSSTRAQPFVTTYVAESVTSPTVCVITFVPAFSALHKNIPASLASTIISSFTFTTAF